MCFPSVVFLPFDINSGQKNLPRNYDFQVLTDAWNAWFVMSSEERKRGERWRKCANLSHTFTLQTDCFRRVTRRKQPVFKVTRRKQPAFKVNVWLKFTHFRHLSPRFRSSLDITVVNLRLTSYFENAPFHLSRSWTPPKKLLILRKRSKSMTKMCELEPHFFL